MGDSHSLSGPHQDEVAYSVCGGVISCFPTIVTLVWGGRPTPLGYNYSKDALPMRPCAGARLPPHLTWARGTVHLVIITGHAVASTSICLVGHLCSGAHCGGGPVASVRGLRFKSSRSVTDGGFTGGDGQGCIGRGEAPPPPRPSRAPSLCPATVSLTASSSFSGICNRQ